MALQADELPGGHRHLHPGHAVEECWRSGPDLQAGYQWRSRFWYLCELLSGRDFFSILININILWLFREKAMQKRLLWQSLTERYRKINGSKGCSRSPSATGGLTFRAFIIVIMYSGTSCTTPGLGCTSSPTPMMTTTPMSSTQNTISAGKHSGFVRKEPSTAPGTERCLTSTHGDSCVW